MFSARTAAYVRAVAEEGNFSKAAEKLYITQPSLSENILKAEKEYGVKFFNRKTTPVVLTYAGEVFLKAADQIERLDEQMTLQLRDIKNNATGRIIVGESPTMSSAFIPTLFRAFHKKFPDVQLSLREGSNPELIEGVKRGRMDLAFVSYDPPEFASIPVVNRELLMARALRDGEQVGPVRSIKMEQLEGEPFILLTEGREIRNLADDLFRRSSFRPKISYVTKSYTLALRMAEEGLGWTFVVNTGDHNMSRRLQYFRAEGIEENYHVRLVYRKDSYLSKPLQYFMDLARQVDQGVL